MCGILGIISQNKINPETALKQLNTMNHRGPDNMGSFIDKENNLFLGHRRLAIIDLSQKANQPLSNENDTKWLVFNGEIYNYLELRKKLETRGHIFKTDHADSEVIIHGYEQWGEEILKKLNGMFSFAIYDKKRKTIFAARDRCGQKPFYYFLNKEGFAFSSELKGLSGLDFFKKELNPKALADYLCFGFIPAPKTIWKNTYKLEPAQYLIYNLKSKKLTKRSYWNLTFKPDYSRKESYWIEGIKENLKKSVKLRTISDAPLGTLLSGGVDSSIVVAILSQIIHQPRTFTVSFDNKKLDESKYARMVAQNLNTKHTEIKANSLNAFHSFEKILFHFDEPFNDYSYFPTFLISKEISNHVKVALSGDGGDELFLGYPRYKKTAKIYNQNNVLLSLAKNISKITEKIVPYNFKSKNFLFRLKGGKSYYASTAPSMGILDKKRIKEILKRKWSLKIKDYSPSNWLHNQFNNLSEEHKDIYDLMRAFDFKYSLPERMLTKTDRSSMANSLEIRSPFLDHKFIEFVSQIPSKYLIKEDESKYILKKAASSLVPPETIYRKKQGFQAPLENWLQGNKKMIKYLKDSYFVKEKVINQLLATQFQKRTGWKKRIYRNRINEIQSLIFLEGWAKKWFI